MNDLIIRKATVYDKLTDKQHIIKAQKAKMKKKWYVKKYHQKKVYNLEVTRQ